MVGLAIVAVWVIGVAVWLVWQWWGQALATTGSGVEPRPVERFPIAPAGNGTGEPAIPAFLRDLRVTSNPAR